MTTTVPELGTSIIEHLEELTADPPLACQFVDCPLTARWRFVVRGEARRPANPPCKCRTPGPFLLCTEHRDDLLPHADERLVHLPCGGDLVIVRIERIR